MGKVFTKTKSYFQNNHVKEEEAPKQVLSKSGVSNIQILNSKLQREAIVRPTPEVVDPEQLNHLDELSLEELQQLRIKLSGSGPKRNVASISIAMELFQVCLLGSLAAGLTVLFYWLTHFL